MSCRHQCKLCVLLILLQVKGASVIVLMEAIGNQYVTNDKILGARHCTLGVDFSHAVGEMGTSHHDAMFVKHRDM
jgi:hypothetical protein